MQATYQGVKTESSRAFTSPSPTWALNEPSSTSSVLGQSAFSISSKASSLASSFLSVGSSSGGG